MEVSYHKVFFFFHEAPIYFVSHTCGGTFYAFMRKLGKQSVILVSRFSADKELAAATLKTINTGKGSEEEHCKLTNMAVNHS